MYTLHALVRFLSPCPNQSRAELDEQLDEARQHVKESVETASLFRCEAEHTRSELSALQKAMEEVRMRWLSDQSGTS